MAQLGNVGKCFVNCIHAMFKPILYIGVSQFVFASLLVFTKRRLRLADKILGGWLLLMGLFMGLTLAKNEFVDTFWSRLQVFPFFFTLGPFLLFYVRTIADRKKQLEFEDSLHLLPFVIFSAVAATQSHTVDEEILLGNITSLHMLVYTVPSLASIIYYAYATIRELNLHRSNLMDHFSYTSKRIDLNWVRLVIISFGVTLFLTIGVIIANYVTTEQDFNPGIPFFLGLTLFGYGVSFFGVRQPAIYHPPPDERFVDALEESELSAEPEEVPAVPPVELVQTREEPEELVEVDVEEEEDDANKKYQRSGLQPEMAERYLERLLAHMEAHKPFLRRDLTVQDLANEVNIPQHHLTQTINEIFNKNFYTLVNEYRVEEVKQRLVDPKYGHLTVLAIAHDAGFNSKSSFNMSFKKIVGLTPSQYRKKVLAEKGE